MAGPGDRDEERTANVFGTDQEAFWAGQFGDAYTARNRGPQALASNLALFARMLPRSSGIGSVLEVGANVGLNLQAIQLLLPGAELCAVEINEQAVAELRKLPRVQVHHASVLEFVPARQFDMVLVKGLLIHIDPTHLSRVYDLMYQASGRFICLVEYYNPTPVSVPYRGHADRLFKRDFAGELLERFSDLRLVDYGFAYHRDPVFPQDDLNWFVLERRPIPMDGCNTRP
jgi:pseudaminic acid biosynthesis-associated methylase